MEEPVRKGQRCPVCKKGAIVERSSAQYGRHLRCSTYNPSNPADPRSDPTMWNLGGVRLYEKTSRKTLILVAVLSVVFFALIFFLLTQTSLSGG